MEKEIDWKLFITKTLDKEFSVDIRKIGSVTDFVRNQIGAEVNHNSEEHRFVEALTSLMSVKEFSPEESLRNFDEFLILFELGIEFLGKDERFIRKCASLFLRLADFNKSLDDTSDSNRQELMIKTSLAVRKFIEKLKTENEILGAYDFYSTYDFLKSVSKKWNQIILNEKNYNNPNAIIGVIYLNEWQLLTSDQQAVFFSLNDGNKGLFVSLLSDMQRVENNVVFDYFSFSQSCKYNYPELYLVIEKKCKYWIENKDEFFVKRMDATKEIVSTSAVIMREHLN